MTGSRVLALDYGTKRIGVALSDELGWTAQPLETFERRTLDRDVAHVASLVQVHAVREVVLGFPLQLDGREGPAIQAMRNFAAHLERGVGITTVTLRAPAGAVAYEFCVPMADSQTDLYVKVQLSHDGQRIMGRSFHYSDRRSSRG